MSKKEDDFYGKAFHKAVKMTREIDVLEAKLGDPTYKRARHKQKIRRLNDGFTRLTERSRELWRLGLEYANENGGKIENITRFIRWLRERKKLPSIQDHALHIRIKNMFGVEGRRGRRRSIL
jgi:hypothetical protein